MTMFGAIGISGSGLLAHRKWLDAVSDNVANINTVRSTDEAAFQARMVVVRASEYGEGGGVRVAGAAFGNPEGRLVHQPDHPLADEDGYVRYPDVDLGDQMVQLMIAQRAYQANLTVVDRSRDTYLHALQIGK